MPSQAAKTSTKKTAKKSAKSKATASKTATSKAKSPSKRETVATLALSLQSLEKRLKGADTKNRNAIKALEIVVSDVKAAAKQGSTNHKAALTRGLSKLEVRMETYLERTAAQAKASVRAELGSVTTSGANLSTLEKALQAAHTRLDKADSLQRESLGRLNRHIADLAVSMDNRLKDESQAREASTADLNAKINSVRNHVDQVEEETANALEAVGSKVAEFAAVLEERAKTTDAETAERLADLAQETRSGIDAAQSDVTTRLEALEVIASAWSPSETTAANPYLPANEDDPRIDQMGEMIASLQEELRRMHARIAAVQSGAPDRAAPTPPPAPTLTPTSASAAISAPNIVPIEAAPVPNQAPAQDNPYAAAAQALENTTETPAPAPVQSTSDKPARESHIPQEFDPSKFAPQAPYGNTNAMPPAPVAPTLSPVSVPPAVPSPVAPLPIAPPPLAPPMASTGTHINPAQVPTPPVLPEAPVEAPLMPAPMPVSTYEDPAYAEEDDMRAERIGGASSTRISRPKLSIPKLPISGQTLRIGGLAVGVAVAGLFAAKTILGGPNSSGIDADPATVRDASYTAPSQGFATPEGISQNANLGSPAAIVANPNSPPPPTAPLGQYAETQPLSLNNGEENTLDAAVQAGNPIAQFQKGLAQLQAGQMEEGARLIRLSANRNQPAAQYRLAKLYETGTGLAKDEITARELIERAARGGNRIAMHDLGNYHAYGQGGLEQNIATALDWFTKAAERGVVDSQFNVAFLREGNEGIPADIETAYFWYQIAARQGDQGAPDRIALLNEQLDPATQAEVKARADRYQPKPVDEAANGVFRNVAWAKKNTGPTRAEKSAEILKIRDAQTLLSELGYEVGAPDGISGSKTRDAVKSFEAVNGLPQTGQITDDLIERLEIASGA